MSTLPKTRIRIKADLFNLTNFTDDLRAGISDYVPKFRAGDDVQIEIGFFNNGTLLDLSGIASVTLELKPLDEELIDRFGSDFDADNYDLRGPDLSLSPIRSKTLTAGDLNADLTEEQWESKAAEHSHVIVTLDTNESNIAAGDRWLTIAVITNDSPGQTRTICAGLIRVLGGGLSQDTASAQPPEDYYNKTEGDARYAQRSQNLADLTDTDDARNNLGLGTTDSPSFAGMTLDDLASNDDGRLLVDDGAGVVGAWNPPADAVLVTESDGSFATRTLEATLSDSAAAIPSSSAVVTSLQDTINTQPALPCIMLDGTAGAVVTPSELTDILKGSSTLYLQVQLADGQPASSQVIAGCINGLSRYWVSLESDGSLEILCADGTTTASVNTGVVFANGPTPWTWLTVVTDTIADTMQCFVNGTAVGSAADISGLTLADGTYRQLAIGARQSSALENFTSCHVAQCLIFNDAHSSSVIAAKVGLTRTEPLVTANERWGVIGGASGCVAWYDFSRDQAGWQVHDRATNQLDAWATPSGTAWSHPTRRGFVRSSHLDIEGVLRYIGSSTQEVLPVDGVWTELILDNHNASSATNVDIEIRDDSSNNANLFNNITLATGKSVRSLAGISQTAGRRYLAFGDTEAQTTNGDDISITAYYELID